jgi:hypothetical protein
MTVPTTYRRQFSHEQQRPNSTLHLFNLYKRSSVFRVLAGSVAPVGLDSADKSTRDVFNDVSKYIGTISISLNAVFP